MAETNPFSTRYVRPGALPFEFLNGESAESVISRLRENDWRGEIIGPHGSGKSTLVAALLGELKVAGRKPRLHTFHDGIVRSAKLTPEALGLDLAAVLILDGYEQFSLWQKLRVRRICQSAGCGLLVTSHTPTSLPPLYRTCVTPELTERVFARLTRQRPALVTTSELHASLAARNGNLREALFDLYDIHEARRRMSAGTLTDSADHAAMASSEKS
jgi:hypothetical protein